MTEVVILIYTYEAAVDFADKLDYTGKNYDAEQVTRWLDGAQVNAGKFVFVKDDAYTNIEKHPNWNPVFYILCDGDNLRRCGRKFAEEMIDAGKGVPGGTTDEFKARRGW